MLFLGFFLFAMSVVLLRQTRQWMSHTGDKQGKDLSIPVKTVI